MLYFKSHFLKSKMESNKKDLTIFRWVFLRGFIKYEKISLVFILKNVLSILSELLNYCIKLGAKCTLTIFIITIVFPIVYVLEYDLYEYMTSCFKCDQKLITIIYLPKTR